MKKIITLFKRDYTTDHLVTNEVNEGAEWVINGEGIATQKFNGTACLVRNDKLYKRYDAKHGKIPPADFEPCQDAPDPITGHWPGWVPVTNKPEDKYHREAFECFKNCPCDTDGTYELCGPMINGNPEGFEGHVLWRHGCSVYVDCPRTFDGLKGWLKGKNIEGIVWHHPDGRMVKIKKTDLGLCWCHDGE